MKMNITEIEVSDHVRKSVRSNAGYKGLATREELRSLIAPAISAVFEEQVQAAQNIDEATLIYKPSKEKDGNE